MKYFDGWATVILPVDVTVQQSGVLHTNSNKTPEKHTNVYHAMTAAPLIVGLSALLFIS